MGGGSEDQTVRPDPVVPAVECGGPDDAGPFPKVERLPGGFVRMEAPGLLEPKPGHHLEYELSVHPSNLTYVTIWRVADDDTDMAQAYAYGPLKHPRYAAKHANSVGLRYGNGVRPVPPAKSD